MYQEWFKEYEKTIRGKHKENKIEENELLKLKNHIAEFINKYNITYIGVDIENNNVSIVKETGEEIPLKDVKINIEF